MIAVQAGNKTGLIPVSALVTGICLEFKKKMINICARTSGNTGST
jgi:hypothetical protein